jgi:hypothetical protein
MGVHGAELQLCLAKPSLGTNHQLPCRRGKVVVPWAGRPIGQWRQPPLASGWEAAKWALMLIHVNWFCPKSVFAESGPFDLCEPESIDACSLHFSSFPTLHIF